MIDAIRIEQPDEIGMVCAFTHITLVFHFNT